MRAYRIVRGKHGAKADAFSGIGAFQFGGRWNTPGCEVAYCSENLSLAVLESIVHLPSPRNMRDYVWLTIDIPDSLLETPNVSTLPNGWNAKPKESAYKEATSTTYGTEWYHRGHSLALRVPSAIIPVEYNLLVNVTHPQFSLDMVSGPFPLTWDERLGV